MYHPSAVENLLLSWSVVSGVRVEVGVAKNLDVAFDVGVAGKVTPEKFC